LSSIEQQAFQSFSGVFFHEFRGPESKRKQQAKAFASFLTLLLQNFFCVLGLILFIQ
jgi:hypothetical protein